jgi:hypothetical protein
VVQPPCAYGGVGKWAKNALTDICPLPLCLAQCAVSGRHRETLEKYARALEVPMYKLFIEDNESPRKPKLSRTEYAEPMWGVKGNERRELIRFAKALSRMNDKQRKLLLAMATRMATLSRTSTGT